MADAAAGASMTSMLSPRARRHKTFDQGELESMVLRGLEDDLDALHVMDARRPVQPPARHGPQHHHHHHQHGRHTSMLGLELTSTALASLLAEENDLEQLNLHAHEQQHAHSDDDAAAAQLESPDDRVPDFSARPPPKQRRSVTFAGSLDEMILRANLEPDAGADEPSPRRAASDAFGAAAAFASAGLRSAPLKSALRGGRAPGHHRTASDTSSLFLSSMSQPLALSRLSSADGDVGRSPATPPPRSPHASLSSHSSHSPESPPSAHVRDQVQQQQQQQQQQQHGQEQQFSQYAQQQYSQPAYPYYGGGGGAYYSPPDYAPPGYPPAAATAEQLQALQAMQATHTHMMAQWMQMQEQHQRLLMLEQQRMAAAAAAHYYAYGAAAPPPALASPPPPPPAYAPAAFTAPLPPPHPQTQQHARAQPSHRARAPQHLHQHHHPQPPRARSPISPRADAAGTASPGAASAVMSAAAQQLLLRHKTSGYRPSAQELRGLVGALSRDGHGSRMIQALNDGWTDAERAPLLDEVLADADALIHDVFANYVVQNLLVRSGAAQREQLVAVLRGRVVAFALDAYGTRVVQRALEMSPPAQRQALAAELSAEGAETLSRLARDANGTHVLQKALDLALGLDATNAHAQTQGRRGGGARGASQQQQHGQQQSRTARRGGPVPGGPLPAMSAADRALFDAVESAVASDMSALSRNQHASRVVLLVLRDCDEARSPAMQLTLRTLASLCESLIWDQQGVFIMGHVLDHGAGSSVARAVHVAVAGNLLRLATHKFGSHLVEKALACADAQQRRALLQPLLDRDGAGARALGLQASSEPSVLLHLAADQYGNFVLSRAFSVSEGADREELAAQVRANAHVLARFTFGRHILHHIGR